MGAHHVGRTADVADCVDCTASFVKYAGENITPQGSSNTSLLVAIDTTLSEVGSASH